MKLKHLGNFNQAYNELKNDKNNCVSGLYEDSQTKSGILKDAIFTIKQNFATDDMFSDASSKILKNFMPRYNATAVQKLIDAGAKKVAKVNCDELALGGTGTHSAYGLIKNPYDQERLAGGSSSGSVATLTDNISFALASDTGDSVRLPASFNGKVGFKPSYGAISRFGLFAFASSLDNVAYFAHNVNDIAILSQVLYGEDIKDMTSINIPINNIAKTKPKKIGILNVKYCENFVNEQFKKLVDSLQKDIKIEVIEPNEKILKAIKPVYEVISFSEASSNLANLNGIAFGNRQTGNNWEEIMTNTRSKGFGEMVQMRLTLGSYFLFSKNQKEIFIKAQQVRRIIKNYFDDLYKKYDLVIFPAYADVAPFIDSKKNKDHSYMEYILTGSNLTGNPSLSLPWIKHNNLFVNLSLEAACKNDEKLLSNALWFEEFLGGKHE